MISKEQTAEFDKREIEFVGEDSENVYQYWINEITRVTIYKTDNKYSILRTWLMGENVAVSVDAQGIGVKELLEYTTEKPRVKEED